MLFLLLNSPEQTLRSFDYSDLLFFYIHAVFRTKPLKKHLRHHEFMSQVLFLICLVFYY